MPTRLRLTTTDLELVARQKSHDWWEVEIRVDGTPHALGADTPSIVLTGLRKAVADEFPGPVTGELNGLPVAWALSLSELHGSIYVAEVDAQRVVFFQDQGARLISTTSLTPDERANWQQRLDAVPTSGESGSRERGPGGATSL